MDLISKQSSQLARSQTIFQCIIATETEKDHCDNWDSQAASLDNGCVALLDGVIDCPGDVADLTDLLVVLVTNLLLAGPVLGDVGIVTLLHGPRVMSGLCFSVHNSLCLLVITLQDGTFLNGLNLFLLLHAELSKFLVENCIAEIKSSGNFKHPSATS